MAKKAQTGKFSGPTLCLQPVEALDVPKISSEHVGCKRAHHRQVFGLAHGPSLKKRGECGGFPHLGKRQTNVMSDGSGGLQDSRDVWRGTWRRDEQHTNPTAIWAMIHVPDSDRIFATGANLSWNAATRQLGVELSARKVPVELFEVRGNV